MAVDFLQTPFLWVVATILLYGVAYYGYGKWIDRKVWRSDAKKTTPAHMYMDGVEYFPVSRYVLWGYQFKSVAALGPILGPFIGVTYGWLPALLWIIGGNFFIGWLQDYGSMMLSVRKEGRSFGPITYEFTGAKGRSNLLAFVLFYLIIISAAFIALIAVFWNSFNGTTFVPTIGILLAGLLCGQLLYRVKMNVFAVTGIGLALVVLSLYLGTILPVKLPWGNYNVAVWAGICVLILYIAAILPTPTFIQPTNYLAFYPAYAAVILILVGALATPFTGVTIQLPAGPFLNDPQGILGPIWPILFVAIACGAISGWHSLVSSSSSSKQLDIETDALPVGGGAMLSEGLLALASLIAYMVLTPLFVFGDGTAANPAHGNIASWPSGAAALVAPLLGIQATTTILTTFFGLVLVIYALTVQALVTRFFRLVAGETWGEGRFHALGNKHVSTVVGRGPLGLRRHRQLVGLVALFRRSQPAPGRARDHADHDPSHARPRPVPILARARHLHGHHDLGRARLADVDVRVLGLDVSPGRQDLDSPERPGADPDGSDSPVGRDRDQRRLRDHRCDPLYHRPVDGHPVVPQLLQEPRGGPDEGPGSGRRRQAGEVAGTKHQAKGTAAHPYR